MFVTTLLQMLILELFLRTLQFLAFSLMDRLLLEGSISCLTSQKKTVKIMITITKTIKLKQLHSHFICMSTTERHQVDYEDIMSSANL